MAIIGTIVSILSASAGLAVNGFILLVLLIQNRKFVISTGHLLLLHLAIVDCLFCLLILFVNCPLSSIADSNAKLPGWTNDLIPIQGLLSTLLPSVILWTISGLSVDRYVAVSAPFSYSKLVTRSRASKWIVVSWIVPSLVSFIPLFGSSLCSYHFDYSRLASTMYCFDMSSPQVNDWSIIRKILSISIFSFNFLLPFLIVISTQVHILVIARSHKDRIGQLHQPKRNSRRSVQPCKTSSQTIITITQPIDDDFDCQSNSSNSSLGQPTRGIGSQSPTSMSSTMSTASSSSTSNRSPGGFALLTILIFSMIILWSPVYVVSLVENMIGHPLAMSNSNHLLLAGSMIFLSFTPSINAYVFGVKSRLLRQVLRRLIERYLYTHEASREIDRRTSVTKTGLNWSNIPANILRGRRYSAPTISCHNHNINNNHLKPSSFSSNFSSMSSLATTSTDHSPNYETHKMVTHNNRRFSVHTFTPLDVVPIQVGRQDHHRILSSSKNPNRLLFHHLPDSESSNFLAVNINSNSKFMLSPIQEDSCQSKMEE